MPVHPLPPPHDSAAPGWYVDPIAKDMLRWWDGTEWSETEFKLVETVVNMDLRKAPRPRTHPGVSPRIASEPRAASFAALAWGLLPAQVFLTGLITYVMIAAWTIIAGAYTEGLQVIGFAYLSAQLTVGAFLVGLPFRIAASARRWWFRHALWGLALFGLAAVGLLLSFVVGDAGPAHHAETAERPATDGYAPDTRVFLPSLLVLAFATMHLLPPLRRWRTAA